MVGVAVVVALAALLGWWAYSQLLLDPVTVHLPPEESAVGLVAGGQAQCFEPSERWLLNLKDWFHIDYQKAKLPQAAYVAGETDRGTVYVVAIRIVAPEGDDVGVATFATNDLPTLAHPRLFEPINALAFQATDEGRAGNRVAALGVAGGSVAENCLV